MLIISLDLCPNPGCPSEEIEYDESGLEFDRLLRGGFVLGTKGQVVGFRPQGDEDWWGHRRHKEQSLTGF